MHHPMPSPMFGGFPGGLLMPGRGLDRMLDGVKATPEQRDQIHKIADAAAADMKADLEAGRSLHEQGAKLFTAPTVDAGAAESLRQQMMAERDKGSRRMLQAMLDVANVLTPEQRQQIAERMAQRHARMEQRQHRAPGARGEPAPNR
jgi:Spy/CpxP family protein refolding chaperone